MFGIFKKFLDMLYNFLINKDYYVHETKVSHNKSDGQTNIDKCRVTAPIIMKKQNLVSKN